MIVPATNFVQSFMLFSSVLNALQTLGTKRPRCSFGKIKCCDVSGLTAVGMWLRGKALHRFKAPKRRPLANFEYFRFQAQFYRDFTKLVTMGFSDTIGAYYGATMHLPKDFWIESINNLFNGLRT